MTDRTKPVVLVTAGASGIGRVIVECFLAHGHAVHLCDIDQAAVDDCLESNPQASATVADASDVEEVDRVFDAIRSLYGRLDVLINNVGIAGPTAAVEDIDPADWDRTINIDLNSAFYVTRRAVPLLKQEGGCIINMASSAGIFGFPLRSPYAAAKWALVGLAKTWAMELGKSGIRVNAICPGSVSGERIDTVIAKDAAVRGLSEEEIRRIYQRQSSMRVFVDAEDIAETVRFLCSAAGRHISGQVLGIDGHTEALSNWMEP
jgi:NAD(P)-dependent dehydrogenase (short-subunit alcohol dehydrogenase family)